MAKIPGDKGGNWRLDKFVEYQHYAPAVDPITYCAYAHARELDPDNCVMLAWYHSLSYCELTASLLLETLEPMNTTELWDYWLEHKDALIFGSARKYVKNMDWFVPLNDRFFSETKGEPFKWLKAIADVDATPKERFKSIERELGKWKYMGRFSVDLFMEAIVSMWKSGLIPMAFESPLEYDWFKTSNLTSGLLNIRYEDQDADIFDKTGRIHCDVIPKLDGWLKDVLSAVWSKYPNQEVDTMSVINKICSFRNLFKSARYGGFHHDRQLGNLIHYEACYPQFKDLWDLFRQIRAHEFPEHMLGEFNGWTGIRKERKKLWVQKGLTGVETTGEY